MEDLIVKDTEIPQEDINHLIGRCLFSSLLIAISYPLWRIFNRGAPIESPGIFFVISIILAVLGVLISALVLRPKKTKPRYAPALIWTAILFTFSFISSIYFLIIPTLIHLFAELRFFSRIKKLKIENVIEK